MNVLGMKRGVKPGALLAVAVMALCMACAAAVALPQQAWAASPVYAYLCVDDSSGDEVTTLVISTALDTDDDPDATDAIKDAYGVITSDWTGTDLTKYGTSIASGGIAYCTGWPWRDSNGGSQEIRESIDQVVVQDGVELAHLSNMFAGLTNCKVFDLSGLDTTSCTSTGPAGYAANMFGTFKSTNNSGSSITAMCSSVEKIIVGENWTLPAFWGLCYSSSTTASYTTFYATARNGEIVEVSPHYYSSAVVDPLPSLPYTYYTSLEAAEANQEADYARCNPDGTEYTDQLWFSTQPSDRAFYAGSSKTLSGLSTSAVATLETATGFSGTVTYLWYVGSTNSPLTATLVDTEDKLWTSSTFNGFDLETPGIKYYYCIATASTGGVAMSNIIKATCIDENDGPDIATQPIGTDGELEYIYGVQSPALSVAVGSNTSFVALYDKTPKVSYQWYQSYNGGDYEAIEGATSSTYYPETRVDLGLYRYYCAVSYSISTYCPPVYSAKFTTDSEVSEIRITSNQDAAPVTLESVAMVDAEYTLKSDEVARLQVKATTGEGGVGTFTYAWYAKASEEGVEDELIAEGDVPEDGLISLLPSRSRHGETEYYCVVTNYYEDSKITMATSDSATVSMNVRYAIASLDDLKNLCDAATGTYDNYIITLEADLDLSADESTATWTGKEFANILFDGQGHTVSGVNAQGQGTGALFASLTDSEVKDLTVEGSFKRAGIAVTATTTDFEGCIVRGDIGPSSTGKTQYYQAGGIVATASSCTFYQCGNEADITDIIRFGDGAGGSVSAGCTGGIAGSATGSNISECYNTGTITAYSPCGITGSAASVDSCYNWGTLVSRIYGSYSSPLYTECDTPYTAGIASSATSITNCYNAGTLQYADGLTSTTKFGAIYSTDKTKPTTYSNNYYLNDGTWSASSATAKTASELIATDMVDLLNGEDGSVWKQGVGYPVLSWQEDDTSIAAPVIADQDKTSFTVLLGDEVDAIAISASYPAVKEAYCGTLTYQWYTNTTGVADGGTAVEGASGTVADGGTISFTPEATATGNVYYYCIVTNTFEGGAESAVSAVYSYVVVSTVPAAEPTITAQPQGSQVAYGGAISLGVTAEVTGVGAGDLSYQWYMASSADLSDAEAIEGATGAAYEGTATIGGDVYYYCVVTNTFEDIKTAQTSSDAALVQVADILVSTAEELLQVSRNVDAGMTYEGVLITLGADIDLSSCADTAAWMPIGTSYDTSFMGEFDGKGHTVSGLNVQGYTYAGLFGVVQNAYIHDLTVEGSVIGEYNASSTVSSQYTHWSGGICGRDVGGSTFENLCNKASVSSGSVMGGILGGSGGGSTSLYVAASTTIKSCVNYGTISGEKVCRAGGIYGFLSYYGYGITVTDCYNAGTIDATKYSSGTSYCVSAIGSARTSSYNGSGARHLVANVYNSGSLSDDAYAVPYGFPTSSTTSYVSNCYYLDLDLTGGTTYGSYGTSATDEELRNASMVSVLNGEDGSAWKQGNVYPVLSWQAEGANGVPRFTEQPQATVYYAHNATEGEALSVAVVDVENETYQWYMNSTDSTEGGTAIEGATASSYMPSTATVGTTYYYCAVTSGTTTTYSATAQVVVASDVAAATPTITAQPVSATYYMLDEATLSVTAEVAGEGAGVLSYQWYLMAGDAPDTEADTAVEGATEASYVLSEVRETASYYCVITNTFEGVKSASTTSEAALVTCVKNEITLSSVAELVQFCNEVNSGTTYEGVLVTLEPGIYDLSLYEDSSTWTPIGASEDTPFMGEFCGSGATITGLNVTDSYTSGLFGYVQGSVSDLTIEGTAAATSGSYSSLSKDGTSKQPKVGLAVAYLDGGEVSNVQVTGEVSSRLRHVGGVVGWAVNAHISDCSASVTVTSTYSTCYAGGIVGEATETSIECCEVAGAIQGTATGSSSGSKSTYVGGIVGIATDCSVYACKNEASVAGNGSTGGIVASAAGATTIQSCYNTGDLGFYNRYTTAFTAGIAACAASDVRILNCFNAGIVDGAGSIGALVSSGAVSNVENCFFLDTAYPEDLSQDITSTILTASQLADASLLEQINLPVTEEGDVDYEGDLVPVFIAGGTHPVLYWETPHVLSADDISVAQGCVYDGTAQTPEVTVTFDNGIDGIQQLVEGTDYTVSYANNVAAGTATVTVEGMGDYAGSYELEFEIAKASLAIAVNSCTKYAGEADPTFEYAVDGLAEGDQLASLAVAREQGEDAGSYAITASNALILSGNALVNDSYDITYTAGSLDIASRTDLAGADVAVSAVYDGNGCNVSYAVTLDGTTLAEGVDYTVQTTASGDFPGSQVTLAVTGTGAYDGQLSATATVASAYAPTFSDVDASDWYVTNGSLDYGYAHGIITGYADTDLYGPFDDITRGQVAVILWRMAGQPAAGDNATAFEDNTDASAYYYEAIRWASSQGVVTGYRDDNGNYTSFGPNDPVTREQLALMIANYASKVCGIDTSTSAVAFNAMPDAGQVDDWARDGLAWCVEAGIITGVESNGTYYLQPLDTAWRASMATIVMRLQTQILA